MAAARSLGRQSAAGLRREGFDHARQARQHAANGLDGRSCERNRDTCVDGGGFIPADREA